MAVPKFHHFRLVFRQTQTYTDTATARQLKAVPGKEGDFIPHAPGLGVCVLDIENRISAVAVWQLLEEVGVSGILITGL